jgi:hypothetical protein
MTAPAEWDCEGCGYRVFAFGQTEIPAHGLCAICAFLCEHVPDPNDMMAVRRALDLPREKRKAAG